MFLNLHSTMSLLKTIKVTADKEGFVFKFTFHYVTIKTKMRNLITAKKCNLHSTMSLLKLFC